MWKRTVGNSVTNLCEGSTDVMIDLFVITKPEIWSYEAANQEMSNITRKSPEARKR